VGRVGGKRGCGLQLPARRHVWRLVAEAARIYHSAADADDLAAAFVGCEAGAAALAEVPEQATSILLTDALRRALGDVRTQRRAHWQRAIGASARSARAFGRLAAALVSEARALQRLAREVAAHDSHASLGAVRSGAGAEATTEGVVYSERRKRQAALDAIGMRWIGECLNEVVQSAHKQATASPSMPPCVCSPAANARSLLAAGPLQARLSHAEIGAQLFAVVEQVVASVCADRPPFAPACRLPESLLKQGG
jgi:hypothetical protein